MTAPTIAQVIARLRNAHADANTNSLTIPVLIGAIPVLLAVAELAGEVAENAQHGEGCPGFTEDISEHPEACICGFTALRAALARLTVKESGER